MDDECEKTACSSGLCQPGPLGRLENEYLFVIYKNCKKPCKGVFGLKIQEKKIRIATVDRCVMCGEIIPEGKQVCGLCKHKTESEEIINESEVEEG